MTPILVIEREVLGVMSLDGEQFTVQGSLNNKINKHKNPGLPFPVWSFPPGHMLGFLSEFYFIN